ncbi:quinone oxidoreductase family protein [Leuconostoc rapi]|uniref:quinone oxidoreductase family protein n=1 Tax=Leuconostoc rapi TaxID=1406906 RepID=UPI001956F472|nr:zinc-binding alcohol dehydrogenase family protein [Leuconostoc rapi]MBM7436236.1 NADPH2:quinone reductase [Leuconostoc rapi]
MKAAVVENFNFGPQYKENYANPILEKNQVVVNVTASALSNRARSGADGSHYAEKSVLPMIPGVDGVGHLSNGQKVFFVGNGTFAEQVAIARGHWVTVDDALDDVKIAGMMNPALSSWMALKYRADFKRGQKVMILFATGNAGALAVQIAKRLGASEIIAVGRNATKLAALKQLGATQTISIADDVHAYQEKLAVAGKDIDIILDYLWGNVAANVMTAIIPHRMHDGQELKWVEIGSSSGQISPIPGAAFRAVRLQLIGSGQGSVGARAVIQSLEEILISEQAQPFEFKAQAVYLSQVATLWDNPGTERLVFVPGK